MYRAGNHVTDTSVCHKEERGCITMTSVRIHGGQEMTG